MKNSSRKTISTIAIVAPAVAREGITKQMANQINGFHLNGFKVCLIVLAKSDLNVLKEYGVAVQQLIVLELHQQDPYLSWYSLKGAAALLSPILKFLEAHQVDVVIAHAPYAHFIMRLVKLRARISRSEFTLIQYFHGLQYSEYPVNTWKRWSINTLSKWLAKHCDNAHISVSGAVKLEIEANLIKHPNHTVVNNCLPDKQNWNEASEQVWQEIQPLLHKVAERYMILLPGRIDYNKGQLFFLKVLEAFLCTGIASAADIAVLIVGYGPQKKAIEQVIQAKKLERVVTLTGALPNIVVQRLMSQAQLVVIPSFKEGFPFVALEALAANCLVLASDTGALKEMVIEGSNGYLFETGNNTDCLYKLKMLYLNRHKVLIDQEAIRNDVKQMFSLERYMQKLLQIIHTT